MGGWLESAVGVGMGEEGNVGEWSVRDYVCKYYKIVCLSGVILYCE